MTDDQMPVAPDAPDKPESLEQLLAAYQEGIDDPSVPSARLSAIALAIAARYDKARDEAAGPWYRVAATAPRWRDDEWLLSWPNAVLGYMLWAHRSSNEELCEAWGFRLVEDAAENGPRTRAYLAGEHKIYRNAWQIACSAEYNRYDVLRHLLAEHSLPRWQRTELARLLSNSLRFGQDDWELIKDLVDDPWPAERSWEAVVWLLEELAAPVFGSISGFDEAASACQFLARQDPRTRDQLLWREQTELILAVDPQRGQPHTWDLWANLHFYWPARTTIAELLDKVGLGERRNLYQTRWNNSTEDHIWENSDANAWGCCAVQTPGSRCSAGRRPGRRRRLDVGMGRRRRPRHSGASTSARGARRGTRCRLALLASDDTRPDKRPNYPLKERWRAYLTVLGPTVQGFFGEQVQQ